MRDGFIFYSSFREAMKTLGDETRLKLYDAICDYALTDNEPDFGGDGVAEGFFMLIKPQIDANNRRRENGKKGALAKQAASKEEANHKQDGSTSVAKEKEKDKEKAKEKGKGNGKYARIRDAYNRLCPSFPSCKTLSQARKRAIDARLNSGYTQEDFEKLFRLAEESAFLKGANGRNWSATFDWLITDSNMAKVLDGNYSKGASPPKPRVADEGRVKLDVLRL